MTAHGDRIGSSGSLDTYTWQAHAMAAEQYDNDAKSRAIHNQLGVRVRSNKSGIIFVQGHYLSTVVFTSH